jgi:hypothetical protein
VPENIGGARWRRETSIYCRVGEENVDVVVEYLLDWTREWDEEVQRDKEKLLVALDWRGVTEDDEELRRPRGCRGRRHRTGGLTG